MTHGKIWSKIWLWDGWMMPLGPQINCYEQILNKSLLGFKLLKVEKNVRIASSDCSACEANF